MTRVAGYVRVSREEQVEGWSLDVQEARIRDYARARGWELVAVYRDEGKSAFSGEPRPGYEQMLADAGTWDAIVTVKMDRLWRNQRRFLDLMDSLDEQGKEYVAIDESWDTSTPMGAFVRDLFARLAQLKSEQTGWRVKQSLDHIRRVERRGLGAPPLGYRKASKEDPRWIIEPGEAETVRGIFARAARGKSIAAITQELNDRATPSKRGGRWFPVGLWHLIHSPVYAGFNFVANGGTSGLLVRGGHEPIVSDTLFNDVQYRLARERRGRPLPTLQLPDDGGEVAVHRLSSGRQRKQGPRRFVPCTGPDDRCRLCASA